MENDDDQIDRFLDGSLSESQRRAFEERLEKDEQLRGRVKLRRDIGDFIGNDGDQFFKALENAERVHYATPKSNSYRSLFGWLLLVGLLSAALLVARHWFTPETEEVAPAEEILPAPLEFENSEFEDQDTLVVVQTLPVTPEESPSEAPADEPKTISQPAATRPVVPVTPTPSEKTSSPVSYVPIAALDALVEDRLRSEIMLELQQPTLDAELDGKLDIVGKINQKTALVYVLYNNEEDRFFNDEAVSRGVLNTSAAGAEFKFSTSLTESLAPALYYLLVMEKETEELLAVTRFQVVE